MSLWNKHAILEKQPPAILVAGIVVAISIGGHRRDRAALLSEEHDREGGRACGPIPRSNWPDADIYVREGCYNCHSQMVRPLCATRWERYGH